MKLKQYGVDTEGLIRFYTSSVRPILTYAAPVWYSHLTKKSQAQLKNVKKTALSMIIPEIATYKQRLDSAKLSTVNEIILN